MSKLTVIEGTDCSGKETQSRLLIQKLNEEGIKAARLSFPMYETSTGRIIGACYLGKEEMCKDNLKEGTFGFFEEGAPNVDPIASSLFYAADRRYNLPIIEKAMTENDVLVLDRYTYSNMAHQGGKLKSIDDKISMFKTLDYLEFEICKLPRPDKVLFLYVPYEIAYDLRNNRTETLDQLESDKEHLKNAEETYLQLAKYYNFETINCFNDDKMKSIEEIHKDVYKRVRKMIK